MNRYDDRRVVNEPMNSTIEIDGDRTFDIVQESSHWFSHFNMLDLSIVYLMVSNSSII